MVFLRPVVMRDVETSNRISAERYDQIRSFQQGVQPAHSILVPINESPVIAPLQKIESPSTPLAAPQSSPGTTPNPLQRKKTPPDPAISADPVPEPAPAASAPGN